MLSRRILPLAAFAIVLVVGSSGGTAAGGPSPGESPPTNVSPPTISGTPIVGATLNGTPGTWSGPSPTYAYEWERCNSSGICNVIGAATGTTYVLAPADLGATTRFAVIATNKNGSTTAASAPTAVIQLPVTTPTTSPPAFNGLASLINSLSCGSDYTQNTEDPAGFWDGLGFIASDGSTCDVSLVSDSLFGKVYRYRVGDASSAGYYDCGPECGTAELTKVQPDHMGRWDWYTAAVKPDPTFRQPTWALYFEPMFPRYTSPPEAIQSAYLDTSGHWCYVYSQCDFSKGPYYWFTRYTGNVTCCLTKDQHPLIPMELGKWTEFVLGIKWADDTTGAYKVYTRVPADGQTSFVKRLDVSGVVTYQWDSSNPGEPSRLTDIQALYEGAETGANGWPNLPTNIVYQRGIQRFDDEASALAAFGG